VNKVWETLRQYTYSNRESRGFVLFRPIPIDVWRVLEREATNDSTMHQLQKTSATDDLRKLPGMQPQPK
jgi:hypothetical protein